MIHKNINVSLFLLFSFSFTQSNLVVINNNQLLQKTEQGKKLTKEMKHFEDNVVQTLEQDRQKLVTDEQGLIELQHTIQDKRVKLEKDELTKKSEESLQSQKEEIQALQQEYQHKERAILQNQEVLFYNAQQGKDYIKKQHYDQVTSFSKETIDRYASSQPWDVILSNDSSAVMYMKPHMNKTDVLVDKLDKQLKAKSKKYQTKKEIKQLFDDIGVVHLESIKKDKDVTNDIGAVYSEFYESNKQGLDALSLRYGKDLSDKKRLPFYVKWVSDQVGFGVFAADAIASGDFIQEYTGVLKNFKVVNDHVIEDTTYSWVYPVVGGYENLHVDSKYQGNEMRFVNHADNPNVCMVRVVGEDGLFHICYVALKDIQKDQQLLISYGDDYWVQRSKHKENL